MSFMVAKPADPPASRLLVLVLALWVATAAAQSTPGDGVSCRIGSPDGARRYRPGTWGLVGVSAINRTDRPAEAAAVLRFTDDLTLQYGRRVVVPANATLRTTCPVLIPASVPHQVWHVDCLVDQVLPPRAPGAKQPTPQDAMLASQPLVIDRELPAVGLIGDLDSAPLYDNGLPYHTQVFGPPPAPDDPVYELVITAKRAQNLTRRLSVFEADDLPGDPAGLAAVDVLVLSSDRLSSDPNGILLVRDWVLGGGHLWIMLDEVQPDTVAAILGDACAVTVVDRVRVMRLRIVNARYDAGEQQPFEDIELEEPVECVRVIPEGVTVTATVDGWPAAFWQSFGAGRVFFTTLSSSAWMRPTTPWDPAPEMMEEETAFYPRESLTDMAGECLAPQPAPALSAAAVEPVLTQQIGYRILNRSAVAAILGAFCLVLFAAGCRFARRGRLEHLLWFAPTVAAVTGLVFLVVAIRTKRAVPPTVATIAHVVLEPGLAAGHCSGLTAMYNQDACRGELGATRGGIFFPDMTALSGRHRRLVWTDETAWHWEELELPSGVRTAPFSCPLPLEHTVDCRARFGPDGLVGAVAFPPFPHLDDAIIMLPHQNAMAVTFHADGTFTSRVDDVLAPGQFLAESLLDDQRRRRIAVYEQLFATQPEIDAAADPVLYGWAGAADLGFVFPQTTQKGSTLLSLGLRLDRSPAGTQVAIAAPFIPYRAVADPSGRPAVAFSNVTRKWVDSKLALTEWLQFSLPPAVLPIQLSRARLSLNVRAPSRSVEVLAGPGPEPVVVLSLSHPIGTYSCVLDRPELLELDDVGRLPLAIRVGDDQSAAPGDEVNREPWTIIALQLSATGTVQGD